MTVKTATKDKRPKSARGPYLSPLVAGTRLLNLALEHVFCIKREYRVKWSIQVSYQDEAGSWVHSASFTSGPAGEME